MKLVVAGDLHLGRSLSDLPLEQAQKLGPSVAWNNLIDATIDRRASALLLTGDVVDRDRVFFEAYGLLEAGIARLTAAGIPVIAVAGNHDTAALPQLADALAVPDQFRILGRDGTWESHTVVSQSGIETTIVGWSFPESHFSQSPLADAPSFAHGPNTIGLLHADLDQLSSPYAPVRSTELKATGVPLWFLGHVHVPTPINGNGIYYVGSLQGLDRSETGSHGAIILEKSTTTGTWKVDRLPLAQLRYERLGPFSPHEFADAPTATKTLTAALNHIRESDAVVQTIAATLVIEGVSDHDSSYYRAILAELMGREQMFASISLLLQRIDCHLIPQVDIHLLSQGNDLCARLAQIIESQSKPEPDRVSSGSLNQEARRIAEEINTSPLLNGILPPASAEETNLLLLNAAQDMLYALLAQRADADQPAESST